ncbi:YopX family protein [Enterococcus durans]|uniref:YopX family protein n=1 Tax=Enterococcus durans TaxID=53345 RepID=UPI0039A43FD5
MIPRFRAYSKEENKMYYPHNDKNVDWTIDDETGFIAPLVNLGGGMWGMIDKYELMQSTTLKDKNGVEIFDGDVVQAEQYLTTTIPVRINGIVKYSNRYTMFYLDNGSERHDLYMQSLGGSIYKFEIIGNIYENSELLEEQR